MDSFPNRPAPRYIRQGSREHLPEAKQIGIEVPQGSRRKAQGSRLSLSPSPSHTIRYYAVRSRARAEVETVGEENVEPEMLGSQSQSQTVTMYTRTCVKADSSHRQCERHFKGPTLMQRLSYIYLTHKVKNPPKARFALATYVRTQDVSMYPSDPWALHTWVSPTYRDLPCRSDPFGAGLVNSPVEIEIFGSGGRAGRHLTSGVCMW